MALKCCCYVFVMKRADRANRDTEKFSKARESLGIGGESSLLFALLQCRKHGKVLEGRRVASDAPACRDLLEQPAHDFSAACLGERVGEANIVGLRDRSDEIADMFAEAFAEFIACRKTEAKRHECHHALAFKFVWTTDDRSFGDGLMGDKGALDLGGP